MRERLIDLLTNDLHRADNPLQFTSDEIVERLADMLLENGVIVLPCNVGDTVYRNVNDKRVKNPCEFKVVGLWYSRYENCNCVHIARFKNGVFDRSLAVTFTDFGKTVFLTREEAEQALKGGVK